MGVLCLPPPPPQVVSIPLPTFTFTNHQQVIKNLKLLVQRTFLNFHNYFSDTEHERNALMENVYPKLREFCQKKGYEFQVMSPLLFKVLKFKVP